MARESSETLLLLGIGLPVGLSDTIIVNSGSGGKEDSIDLEVASIESNAVLKRKIGLSFSVKE